MKNICNRRPAQVSTHVVILRHFRMQIEIVNIFQSTIFLFMQKGGDGIYKCGGRNFNREGQNTSANYL